MRGPRLFRGLIRGLGMAVHETAPYECQRCEERYRVEFHVCPACGSFRVERVVWGLSPGQR